MTRTAMAVGDGVVAAMRSERAGEVVGCFSSGFYVRAGCAVFAITGPDIAPGPLHLQLPSPLQVPERSFVGLHPHWIEVAGSQIHVPDSSRWSPGPLTARGLRRTAQVLVGLEPPDELICVWSGVGEALGSADLHGARVLLEGRGSGLTPTGDDVLAGALLAWSDAAEASEVAAAAATSALSRQFLYWAARGQSIDPVHRLIAAAEAGDHRGARAVAQHVMGIGHTSGRALLGGLALAVDCRLGYNTACHA